MKINVNDFITIEPLTCAASEVYVGKWHASDLDGLFVPADHAAPYFDRRALEREGWILQHPDELRGAPFSRALHPKAKGMGPRVYLINHNDGSSQREDGPVVQVVYVPVGTQDKTWVAGWNWNLKEWYDNDADLSGRFCCGVLFIKSDS